MKSILDAVLSLITTKTTYSPVVGSLPSREGVAVQIATGAIESAYLPRTELHRDTLVINAKYKSQADAINALDTIHKALTKRIGYSHATEWQIVNISTSTAPDYLGQEGNEWYLYGSSVVVEWYDRRKAEDTPL